MSLNRFRFESLRLSALNKTNELLKDRRATDFKKVKLSSDVKFALGNKEGGLKDLATAVQLKPDDDYLRRTLARLLVRNGKHSDAREHVKELLRKHPKSAEYQKLWQQLRSKLD